MKKKLVIITMCFIFMIGIINLQVAAASDFQPLWPLKNSYKVTALDRYKDGTLHGGMDIGNNNDPEQAVFAVAGGKVLAAEKDGTYGNTVLIQHTVGGKNYCSRYAHLSSIDVSKDQWVDPLQKIGNMGHSGGNFANHLHLEIYEGTKKYPGKNVRKQTFGYYIDGNKEVLKNISLNKDYVAVSALYKDWIYDNCSLQNGRYCYDQKNTCNHQYDSAHKDKCWICGATFTPSYSDIYTTYEVKNYDTPLYSEPYNSSKKIKLLSPGYEIYVKRSFTNSLGNPWYEVDGGYIYAPNLQPAKVKSSLYIDLTKYPEDLNVGSSYGLRGTVSSNYNITQVNGYIKNSNGNVVQSSTDRPNSKSMDIRTADLNNDLLFNKLSAGNYTMEVEAVDASGYVYKVTKYFTVGGGEPPVPDNHTDIGAWKNTTIGVVSIPSSWDNLSIRSGPSTSYDVVGSMNQGETCTVYTDDTKNGWYHINYNGIDGYASGKQIKLQSQTTESRNIRTGVVNIPSSWDNLSIRSGPSTSHGVIGSMNQGETCTVYIDDTQNGWYHVNYNGIDGYASGKQIILQ